MKYISKISKISSFIFYIFLLCQLWHLCQYGSIRSHFFGVVICTVGFTAAVIVWLVSRRKKLEEDTERIINDWGFLLNRNLLTYLREGWSKNDYKVYYDR